MNDKLKKIFEDLPHEQGTIIYDTTPQSLDLLNTFQGAGEEEDAVDNSPITVNDLRDIIVDLIDEDEVSYEETILLNIIGYMLDYMEDSDEEDINFIIQQLNVYAGLEGDDAPLEIDANIEIPPTGYEMGSDGSTDIDEMDDGAEGESYEEDGELAEAGPQFKIRHGKKVRTRKGFRKSAHGGFVRISRATLMKMKRSHRKVKGRHLKRSTVMKMKRSRQKTMRRFGNFIRGQRKH